MQMDLKNVGWIMHRDEKLMTVDIKTFSREELEMAYENLRKISAMKTEFIKKIINSAVKRLPS